MGVAITKPVILKKGKKISHYQTSKNNYLTLLIAIIFKFAVFFILLIVLLLFIITVSLKGP